jgi:hypothetical protein
LGGVVFKRYFILLMGLIKGSDEVTDTFHMPLLWLLKLKKDYTEVKWRRHGGCQREIPLWFSV